MMKLGLGIDVRDVVSIEVSAGKPMKLSVTLVRNFLFLALV